ncbi:angiopoietin-related protein 7-like [Clytia hemisphaerica]
MLITLLYLLTFNSQGIECGLVPFRFVGRNVEISGQPIPMHEMESTHFDFCFRKCIVIKCHYIEYEKLMTTSTDVWSCKLYGLIRSISDHLVSKLGSILYNAEQPYIDCDDWFKSDYKNSGVYEITFNGKQRDVYCTMDDVNSEGWTVIQKRIDGSVDFNQYWSGYKTGFGEPESEYWLGNDDIHFLTSMQNRTVYLKISATSFEGESTHVVYKGFTVENEENKYKLHTGNFFSGNSQHKDNFLRHNNMYFSTQEFDNDMGTDNCAADRLAGFWYFYCAVITPNGKYYSNQSDCVYKRSLHWYDFKGRDYCLKTFEMAIRIANNE